MSKKVFFIIILFVVINSSFLFTIPNLNTVDSRFTHENMSFRLKTEQNSLKIMESQVLTDHTSLRIHSNNDFEKLAFTGEGSINNPYIIENLNITDSSERLLDIKDTNSYFEIRNNRFNGLTKSFYGIVLSNVTNGIISDNIIESNKYKGIVIGLSENNLIKENWISNHGLSGIEVHDSNAITIRNNIIFENHELGIWLRSNVKNSIIEENSFRKNINYGILIGYWHRQIVTSCSNNLINRNNFIENNINENNKSQVRDYGISNEFINNYWSEWKSPDIDGDAIVDIAYPVDGIPFINDMAPLVNWVGSPVISKPVLLNPKGGDNLDGLIVVKWNAAIDSMDFPINYTISLSIDDGKTWEILADNLIETEFEWDVSSNSEGNIGILKVEAKNSHGIIQIYILETPFTIRKPTLEIFIDNLLNNDILKVFLLILLVIIIIFLVWVLFRKKIVMEEGVLNYVSSFKDHQIREIYHKIFIGLENVKAELHSQSDIFSKLDTGEYPIIGNIFPSNIQQEMKSSIKGRTVLILIEVAYQPITNSNISFLSKALNIPQQTASDEMKKLKDSEYLQPCSSIKSLMDTRKKNYCLTEKGLVFLHLLKESLTTTITKMKKEEIHVEMEKMH